MKILLKISFLLLFTLNCYCQTLPLNSPEDPNNGGYLKDLDNVLPFWVGTWKGVVNNKEYTFQFTTFLHHIVCFPSGNYYYKDKLMGKFKVVDLTTNEVLYDDLSDTNFVYYNIELIGYNIYNGYTFLYNDDDITHCNNKTKFTIIKSLSNPNQVTYTNFEYTEFISPSDCIYPEQEDIPMFLPKVNLILTRQ